MIGSDELSFVQLMAWHLFGAKLLAEQMITQVTDAFKLLQASMC